MCILLRFTCTDSFSFYTQNLSSVSEICHFSPQKYPILSFIYPIMTKQFFLSTFTSVSEIILYIIPHSIGSSAGGTLTVYCIPQESCNASSNASAIWRFYDFFFLHWLFLIQLHFSFFFFLHFLNTMSL